MREREVIDQFNKWIGAEEPTRKGSNDKSHVPDKTGYGMLGLKATKVYFLLHVHCGLVVALLHVIFAASWRSILYLKCWQPSWQRKTDHSKQYSGSKISSQKWYTHATSTHISLANGLNLRSMRLRDLILSRKGLWICFNMQSTTSQDDSWLSGLKNSPNWSTRQRAMRMF